MTLVNICHLSLLPVRPNFIRCQAGNRDVVDLFVVVVVVVVVVVDVVVDLASAFAVERQFSIKSARRLPMLTRCVFV